jgi:hypothetical protein
MPDAHWKTVVDMEMHDMRVNILELKATVVGVGAMLTGLKKWLWDPACHVKKLGDKGGRRERPSIYTHDSDIYEQAPENQVKCPDNMPKQPPVRTSDDPSEDDDLL